MSPDLLVGFTIGILVYALNAWVRKDAPVRHARYRMRVKLARWLLDGKLHDVYVRKPRATKAAQRGRVLSAVRREDSSSGAA